MGELENLAKLLDGVYLQMCTKVKEMYKDKTNEELLSIYEKEKQMVEDKVKEFREKASLVLRAFEEMLAERGIKA